MLVATGQVSEPSTATCSSVQWSPRCRHFEFNEILSATENFAESLVIGRGGFGKVYKGNINNGSTLVVAAIKRLDSMSNQGAPEFWAEVEMLSKLRHCHLVSLIGYCSHETEMILVYDYMPNGTLEDHLHRYGSPLSWCERLKICIGAARGLDYLHTGTGIEFGIIHRDVKSSNILLDESWAAKVSDFGLSKITPRNQPSTYVSTLVKGTFGYIDPNYFSTGRLTRKSDVYAFGVVLLEVLCRKRAVDNNSFEFGIVTWALDSIKEGRPKDIVDSDITGEISPNCLKHFAQIAERCLDNHPKHRPTMAEVVISLEYVLTLQEKTDNAFKTARKTIFGKIVDKFSLTDNDQNSGMNFGSLIPKKPNISMEFGSLMAKKLNISMSLGSHTPKKEKKVICRQKFFHKYGSLILKDKLKYIDGSIKVFQAKELEKATMNYAEHMILGRGSYGIVYKGILPDNSLVAIKRSNISEEGQVEKFIDEIVTLVQVSHKNVVKLFGCCLETEVPMLAYEFVSNGTLSDHIHNNTSSTGRLPWDSRLRIAHESAGALAYLHSHAPVTIIHSDVNSANILLDENYTAKVSDFGLSKSVPLGQDQASIIASGTLGYLDPEYMVTSQLTDKSDVYSFGVVLAEILTGLKPIDSERDEEDINLATYFLHATTENRLREIVDHQVLEEVVDDQLDAVSYLVRRCLDMRGEDRPSMKEVTMELERLRKFSIDPVLSKDKDNSLMTESE